MVLKVLSDWDFTPKFAGNKDMVIVFHQLSGAEELKLGVGDNRNPEQFITSVVKRIEHPIKLDFGKGKPRYMKASDIANIGTLKDLYFELLIEYSNHTTLSEEDSKN